MVAHVRFDRRSACTHHCLTGFVVSSSRVAGSRALAVASFLLLAALGACHDDPIGPPPTHEKPVAVTYCAPAAPIWVAFRDGDGSWTRELADAAGSRTTFRHVFLSDHAAIASLTPSFDGEFTVLRVLYGTPDELATEGDTVGGACVTDNGKTLRGTVAGLDTTEGAFISVGSGARASVFRGLGPDFSLEGVANGPQDLLAAVTRGNAPTRLIFRRNLDLPEGALIPTLDFASAEAFDVATPNVAFENLGGESAVNLTELITPHGKFTLPFVLTAASTAEPYAAFPADKLLDGDLELLHVSTGGGTTRTADVIFRSPVDRTLALGAPMVPPTVSNIPGGTTVRLRAQFVPQADYDRTASVVYFQSTTIAFVAVTMTSAYAALAGGYVLDVPDLSSVSGFDSSWGLEPGAAINWSAFRIGGTFPLDANATPAINATRRTSETQGIFAGP